MNTGKSPLLNLCLYQAGVAKPWRSKHHIISRRLGHSKVNTALDIYGHLIPKMQNEAAKL